MHSPTGKVLWSAFGALALLVIVNLTLIALLLALPDRPSPLQFGLLLVGLGVVDLSIGLYALIRTDRLLKNRVMVQVKKAESRISALADAALVAERAALVSENSRLYTEQMESHRRVEDLSRLKDDFLSMASHELRTPVTSIKGYTQLAKRLIRDGDLDTSEEYLEVALDQIDRMSRLILELLDVSRIETGRLEIRREPIRWAAFVLEAVHRRRAAADGRRLTVNQGDADLVVEGDRDRLDQVIGNLLENALKYSPEGSEVTVTVQTAGGRVVTAICDLGMGIPTDELGHVFERFHRGRHVSPANYGGLGLGLYISKQIVDRHGGSIWVESREGHGTTFSFALSFREPAPGAMPAA